MPSNPLNCAQARQNYQDTEVIKHLQDLGIVTEAWYPLGGRGHVRELMRDPVLTQIAEKHDKSVAQVIIRWHLKRSVVAIPGSSNPDHIKENISVFDRKTRFCSYLPGYVWGGPRCYRLSW